MTNEEKDRLLNRARSIYTKDTVFKLAHMHYADVHEYTVFKMTIEEDHYLDWYKDDIYVYNKSGPIMSCKENGCCAIVYCSKREKFGKIIEEGVNIEYENIIKFIYKD